MPSFNKSFINLTNNRFGKLLVLSHAGVKGKQKKHYWKCRCDCGNEKIVCGGNLKNGHTSSCGCYQKQQVIARCFIDLEGQKYGRLLVLSQVIGEKYWKCICDCGMEIKVTGASLRSGNTCSCGCYHKEQTSKAKLNDLTGQKFGKLLVLARAETRKDQPYWTCRCECGIEKSIAGNSLVAGKSKSCGCRKGRFTHGLSNDTKAYKKFLYSNPLYRLKHHVGGSVNRAIKKMGKSKGGKTFDYLPYTSQELKEHIELLWEPWMTWDIYGGGNDGPRRTWHIDHIIPHSSFVYDSLDHPDFLKCWSLSNLRPLEKIENIRKGCRFLDDQQYNARLKID